MTLSPEQLRALQVGIQQLDSWLRSAAQWLDQYKVRIEQQIKPDLEHDINALEQQLAQHEQGLRDSKYPNLKSEFLQAKKTMEEVGDFNRTLVFEGRAAELQSRMGNLNAFGRIKQITVGWAETITQQLPALNELFRNLEKERADLQQITNTIRAAQRHVTEGIPKRLQALDNLRADLIETVTSLEQALREQDYAKAAELLEQADRALAKGGVEMDTIIHLLLSDEKQLELAKIQATQIKPRFDNLFRDEIHFDKELGGLAAESTVVSESASCINAFESFVKEAGAILDAASIGKMPIATAAQRLTVLETKLARGLDRYDEFIRRDTMLLRNLTDKPTFARASSSIKGTLDQLKAKAPAQANAILKEIQADPSKRAELADQVAKTGAEMR